MTKRMGFKLPDRATQEVQDWVEGGVTAAQADGLKEAPAKVAPIKQARLTIDLPTELHARFKAACAIQRTRMVDEVTRFIEDWTQKHR